MKFRSSGSRGFSTAVADDPHRIHARKIEHEVTVRFTPVACQVQTREGMVMAQPGDAILLGMAGEQWRVSKARFAEKYRPAPHTTAGEAGRYVSLPNKVMALRMPGSFEVLLADGTSRLSGRAGDWLVDYGDGSLGIVAKDIFTTTYEILD